MELSDAARRQTYETFYREFAWNVPSRFNFADDVVDRWSQDGDGPALIAEDADGAVRRFTYGDMSRLTRRFANVLRSHGVGKGDFVLVMLPRIPEWQIAMVAALRLGAIPIPCIEMLTARDLAYRLDHSRARAIVCRASQTDKFSAAAGVPVRIAVGEAEGWLDFDAEMATASADFAPVPVAAEDPAIMYYTSGSTGHPKGVLHASRALWAWRVSAVYWLDLARDDVIWCTADTGWSKAGTSILFGPWACGACAFFYDGPYDPAGRLRLLEKHRISVYCAPATELLRVAEADPGAYRLDRLRRTVSAGEAVNPVVASRWRQAAGLRVDEAYGQTEALMLVLNYPGEEARFGSMGRPAPGSRVEILGPDAVPVADGEEGDIALLTPHPQLMLGYHRDPERTAACFVDGPAGRWYVTGDRARRDARGYIWYCGRQDDIINSSGYRIGPMEVESVLQDHPAVAECAVVGKPDAARGEIVKAHVVLRPGFEPSDLLVAELQDCCKQMTAPYKFPREIAFVDAIPKTLTGKVRRGELRERDRMAAAGQGKTA